jgi:type I restriction-modification system DNA methylase subunit
LSEEINSVSMEKVREKIRDLVERYDAAVTKDQISQFSEADVGSKFILPLLEALGWDTKNIDEVKEQKRTLTGPADYSLNVRKTPKVIVEIKKLTEDLDSKRVVRGKEEGFAHQATRYAWHLKVDWCVLSNFKETRLYYAHTIRPEDGLIFKFTYDNYLDALAFQKLWLLSKESVLSGKLDTLEKRRTRSEIDKEILNDLFDSRKLLVNTIEKNNPKLSRELVKESVQKILNRILVIRVSEDRGVIGADSLWRELESWQNRGLPTPFMRSLKSLFRDFDEIYNSKLFEPHQCEDLIINNNVLERILSALYKYNFDLISADILGAIYEDYIGHILSETEKGKVEIVESRAERKRGGIYYTPTYIVDYIVKNTLGERLKTCKTPDEVSKIKVLDPACGSGSFLIKAFDVLKQWYDDYNQTILSRQNRNTLEAHFEVVQNVEMKILDENLFGVDLDPQAAEIAAVNLMLKALRKREKLPQILGVNVKIGNSLLSGSESELKEFSKEEIASLKPFNYETEFAGIFGNGGFDVVVGNPPYFKVRKDNAVRFSEEFKEIQSGMMNVAAVFISKALRLTRSEGYVGLIVPKLLAYTQSWNKIRLKIFKQAAIQRVIDCGKAFENVLLEQAIIVLNKTKLIEDSEYSIGDLRDQMIVLTAKASQRMSQDSDLIFLEPNPLAYNIRNKMASHHLTLEDVTDIRLGAGIQSFKCFRETPREGDLKILRGDDVQRYFIRGSLYFSREAPEMKPYLNEIEKFMRPHIVCQRIVAHVMHPQPHIILMSAYESSGAFAFNTVTNIFVTDSDFDYRYILALLNSKLFSYYAYKFLYSNAIRSMDFYEGYAKRLPVHPLSKEKQKPFIELVDMLIRLKCEYLKLVTDFERYWAPLVDQITLRAFYDRLPLDSKQIINRTAKGLIKNVKVLETGNVLTFTVDYSFTENREKKEFYNVPVLKCRIEDKALRKFIFHTMLDHKGWPATGNLSSKILSTPMPRFDKDEAKNMEAIRKVMNGYLKTIDEKEKLDKEIREIDGKIDDAIFKLYDLTDEEVNFVKGESGS